MNKQLIKYLVISDIHLGHNINKTEYIVNNLRDYIFKNKKFKDLDIIFIAGDIFDRLLNPSSNDMILACVWLTELVKFCKERKIKLRILEGTPSHDWKQAKLISNIIEKLNIEIDYKYIDTLFIEDMEDLGLSILYIPDEYKHKASDTFKDVKKLMKSLGKVMVDIAIMHGQFNYQLPIKLESSHDEEDYRSIVRFYINIGHIHTHSVRQHIIAQGSFDRLAHGEEEDKGAVLVTLEKIFDKIGFKYEFIPNHKAMIFKTVDYKDHDIEYILKDLSTVCKKLPIPSNLRILTKQHSELSKNLPTIKTLYPGINIKIENKEKQKVEKLNLLENKVVDESFNITKENIRELMDNEMKVHGYTKEQLAIYEEIMKEVV